MNVLVLDSRLPTLELELDSRIEELRQWVSTYPMRSAVQLDSEWTNPVDQATRAEVVFLVPRLLLKMLGIAERELVLDQLLADETVHDVADEAIEFAHFCRAEIHRPEPSSE